MGTESQRAQPHHLSCPRFHEVTLITPIPDRLWDPLITLSLWIKVVAQVHLWWVNPSRHSSAGWYPGLLTVWQSLESREPVSMDYWRFPTVDAPTPLDASGTILDPSLRWDDGPGQLFTPSPRHHVTTFTPFTPQARFSLTAEANFIYDSGRLTTQE